ncbi:DNA-binding protein, partial [Klebsiella oxytoca]
MPSLLFYLLFGNFLKYMSLLLE